MSNEWIEWNGGEQPVPDGALVDVEFRCGDGTDECRVDTWDWCHPTESNPEFADYDIVRYRVRD